MIIEQGSPEWFALRLGKITASKISVVMMKDDSETKKKYKLELVRERIGGSKTESYTNAAMERGTALEPLARVVYEMKNNVSVEQVAFVNHPVISNAGASPDGLVGRDGLLEIKCPNPVNHLQHILDGGVDLVKSYKNQVMFQLACTGKSWCDLVSFDPDLPDDLQLFRIRIDRDNELIKEMEEKVMKFDDEITKTVLFLTN
jgi:putative phage-type endonuclease